VLVDSEFLRDTPRRFLRQTMLRKCRSGGDGAEVVEQRLFALIRKEQAVDLVLDDLPESTCGTGDDRNPANHRLEGDEPLRFGPARGHDRGPGIGQ
jgi:hypothetical protein